MACFNQLEVWILSLSGKEYLRVGLSTSSYEFDLTDGQRDGIGVYTGNLLQSLERIGGAAGGIGMRRFYYPPSLLSSFGYSDAASATRFHLPYPVSGFLSYALNLNDLNSRLIKDSVDVFHCTDYKIPKLKDTPVIATLYDAIPLKNPEWASGRLRTLKNRVMKNSAGWADHIITISDFVVEDVVEYWGVSEDIISVVHCGVDDEWFHKQSEKQVTAVKNSYLIEKSYILFVGTFQPRKNIGRIIDAYTSLSDVYRNENILVLVGKEGWGGDDLQGKIEKLVVKGQCIRIKNASDSDVRCLYQAAAVFLFPSLYEGFGLPVLEAFASGVPVITSKNTALEEVAGDDALLVDPYSVEDIADKLKYLLDLDMVFRNKIIESGITRARQFSWDKAAISIYEIYKKFV